MVERKELSKEEIARRAYELYVQRGSEPGSDVEDWLRVESELSSGANSYRQKRMQSRQRVRSRLTGWIQ